MIEHLTQETFKTKVFDLDNDDPKKYIGSLPCIIDFYADWCGPCKMVAPILEELSNEYENKILIYKINTEEQSELTRLFGIRSIPSMLFVPMDGEPQMSVGALPRNAIKSAIDDFLLK